MNTPTQLTWQTHSIEKVYDNPWITVSHRNVTAPTGTHCIYGLVHFKQLAVGVVPIDTEGYTWLVGQQRYTIDQYTWEIPEGGGAFDEDSIETAQRELLEETGISASRWTPLLELHTSNSVTDERAVAYVAQGLTFGDVAPDDTEILQVCRISLDDAIDRVIDGRITDGLAMAALMKVRILLDRGDLHL